MPLLSLSLALLLADARAELPDTAALRLGLAAPTFAPGFGGEIGGEVSWSRHAGVPAGFDLVTGASLGLLPDVTCPILGGDCRETFTATRLTGSLRRELPGGLFAQGGLGAYLMSDAVRFDGQRAGGTALLFGPQASLGVALPFHPAASHRRFTGPELRLDAHVPGFRPRETTFLMGLSFPIGLGAASDVGGGGGGASVDRGPTRGTVARGDCTWQVVERRLTERRIAWDDEGLKLRHQSGRLDTVLKVDEVDVLKESLVVQDRIEVSANAKGGLKLSGTLAPGLEGGAEAGASASASRSRTETTTTEHADTVSRASVLTDQTHIDLVTFSGVLKAQEVWRFDEVWAWRGSDCPTELGGEVSTRTVEHRGASVSFRIADMDVFYTDTQAPGARRPDVDGVQAAARRDLAGAVAQGHWLDRVDLPLPSTLPDPLELGEGSGR